MAFSDVIRHCRTCPECCEYHRGKLPRQGRLQPVSAAGSLTKRVCVEVAVQTGDDDFAVQAHEEIPDQTDRLP